MAETNENAPATKADLNAGLGSLRLEMLERIEHVETTLLKEFRKWAVRNDSTLRVHDARSATISVCPSLRSASPNSKTANKGSAGSGLTSRQP
jgi:hypothetical protein